MVKVLAAVSLTDYLQLGVILLLAAIAAAVALRAAGAVKRRLMRDPDVATFTLQDLREMRAQQQISEQEFNVLRAEILRRAREKPDDSGPAPPPPV